MTWFRKCSQCGLELSDRTASACPICGASLPGTGFVQSNAAAARGAKIWIGALFQFAISSIFMLVFGFPKIMIAAFGIMILLGATLTFWVRANATQGSRPPQRPVAHLALFRVLTLAIGLCSVACFASLLFGFVAFADSWSGWQQYKGAPYHRADFQVTHTYYNRGMKGAVYISASGTVEGQREWMNLQEYVHPMPHSEAELDARVPAGTSIPIYLFPDKKGRARVKVFNEVPTAEAYHRAAINAVNYGLAGVALTVGIIFVLVRLRRFCFAEPESTEAFTNQVQVG